MVHDLPRVSIAVEDRIILHLSNQIEESDRYLVGPEVTRPGIAEACGLHPPNVSRAMRSLGRKGLVSERTCAIRGETRRQKTWQLTTTGQSFVAERRVELQDILVLVRDSEGKLLEVPARDASLRLDARLDLLSILMFASTEGVLTFGDIRFGPIASRSPKPDEIPGRLVLFAGAHSTYDIVPPAPRKMHGRADEIELIDSWFDANTPVLAIHGIAGIGKSTLIAHWIRSRRPESEGHSLCWYPCQPWDTATGIATSLLHRFGVRPGHDPHHLIDALPRRPGQQLDVDGLRRRLASYLIDPSSVREIFTPPSTESPSRTNMSVANEGEPPPIWFVVLDDVHHVDPDPTGLLSAFVDLARQTPLRLVMISRTRPKAYDRRDVHVRNVVDEISLDGLSESEVADWIESMEHRPALDPDELRDRTGGHPLALELLELYGSPQHHDWRGFLDDEILGVLPKSEADLLAVLAEAEGPVPWIALASAAEFDGRPPKRLVEHGLLIETESGWWMHEALRERLHLDSSRARQERRRLLNISLEKERSQQEG